MVQKTPSGKEAQLKTPKHFRSVKEYKKFLKKAEQRRKEVAKELGKGIVIRSPSRRAVEEKIKEQPATMKLPEEYLKRAPAEQLTGREFVAVKEIQKERAERAKEFALDTTQERTVLQEHRQALKDELKNIRLQLKSVVLRPEARKELQQRRKEIIDELDLGRGEAARPTSLFEAKARMFPVSTGYELPRYAGGKLKAPFVYTPEERTRLIIYKPKPKPKPTKKPTGMVKAAPKVSPITKIGGKIETGFIRTVTRGKYGDLKSLWKLQTKPVIQETREARRRTVALWDTKLAGYEDYLKRTSPPIVRIAYGIGKESAKFTYVYPETVPITYGASIPVGVAGATIKATATRYFPRATKGAIALGKGAFGTAVTGYVGARTAGVDFQRTDTGVGLTYQRPKDYFIRFGEVVGEAVPTAGPFAAGYRRGRYFIERPRFRKAKEVVKFETTEFKDSPIIEYSGRGKVNVEMGSIADDIIGRKATAKYDIDIGGRGVKVPPRVTETGKVLGEGLTLETYKGGLIPKGVTYTYKGKRKLKIDLPKYERQTPEAYASSLEAKGKLTLGSVTKKQMPKYSGLFYRPIDEGLPRIVVQKYFPTYREAQKTIAHEVLHYKLYKKFPRATLSKFAYKTDDFYIPRTLEHVYGYTGFVTKTKPFKVSYQRKPFTRVAKKYDKEPVEFVAGAKVQVRDKYVERATRIKTYTDKDIVVKGVGTATPKRAKITSLEKELPTEGKIPSDLMLGYEEARPISIGKQISKKVKDVVSPEGLWKTTYSLQVGETLGKRPLKIYKKQRDKADFILEPSPDVKKDIYSSHAKGAGAKFKTIKQTDVQPTVLGIREFAIKETRAALAPKIKYRPKPVTKPPIAETYTAPKIDTITYPKVLTKPRTVLKPRPTTTTIPTPKVVDVFKPTSVTQPRIKPTTRITPRIDTTPKQQIKPVQQIRTVQEPVLQPVTGAPGIVTPTIRPPPTYFEYPPFIPKKKKRRYMEGFAVFLRRKGEFKQIGVDLPKGKALALGAKRARKTLAATFKIKPTGRPAKVRDIPTPRLKPEFREFKIRGRERIPTPSTFIQRRKFRLASPTEVGEIQLARLKV